MKRLVLDVTATGRKIRDARNEKHITVARLVELLNLCSEQAVYKWQRGESMPTLDNLVLLSDIFNIPMDELIQKKEVDIEVGR